MVFCNETTQEKQHFSDTFMMDILDNALMIDDAPWSNISTKDLQHMLDPMDNVVNIGFILRCLDVCRQKGPVYP